MDTFDSICRARPLLGTFVEIAASGAARRDLQAAIDQAFAAIAQVHRLMSFHDLESDVSRLNREACTRAVAVHAWTYRVLETAVELHHRSAGLFDIAVAPLLQKQGLLPRGADDSSDLAVGTMATVAIELLADDRVRYHHPGIKIDLGGIAKGFAVDRAVEVLRERGLVHGLVNAGGDLAAFGPHPALVHVRNPTDACRPVCQVEIRNAALASSGRLFDPLQFADIGEAAVFDPRTGKRVHTIAGATVRAPCCMIADALTKVVMIAGEAATGLLSQYQASALFAVESGDVWVTSDWQNAVRLAA